MRVPDFNQVEEHVDLSSSYYRVCTDPDHPMRLWSDCTQTIPCYLALFVLAE